MTIAPVQKADAADSPSAARVVALYLPQYHPIPENDAMWGAGFTEWRTVARARALYPGHVQPRRPTDLGYYDLRVPEVRMAQAEMASAAGIEAFCYYHYWFGGRRLLQRPFDEVLTQGQPEFPFCLCWANESWTGVWVGRPEQLVMEQVYPGLEDQKAHWAYLRNAFADPRYLRIDGRPVFFVYRPAKIPDVTRYVDFWREQALADGFPGLHLIAVNHRTLPMEPKKLGFDAVVANRLPDTRPWVSRRDPRRWLNFKLQAWRRQPTVYSAEEVLSEPIADRPREGAWYPTVYPNWDTTPRHRERGLVMHGANPALFEGQLRRAVESVSERPHEHRLVLLKSWNEWAEGNYVEPDELTGHGYLDALRRVLRPTANLATPSISDGQATAVSEPR